MKRKNVIALLLGLGFLLGAVANVAAQSKPGEHTALSSPAAPKTAPQGILTYQGRLTTASGVPINSPVNVVFSLYDSGGVKLWDSAIRTITPANGLFTVNLGDTPDPVLWSVFPAASIGVTVGSDPEMTPRQPFNSVYGYNTSGWGVTGYSTTGAGVVGASSSGAGVVAITLSTSFGAVRANNGISDGTGPALEIAHGGIKVTGAGVDTTTPVFMHKVIVGGSGNNVCAPFGPTNYATIIDNPLTNGDPDAILIVTPNYRKSDNSQSGGTGPAKDIPAVFYSVSGGCGNLNKWVIYNSVFSTAMLDNTFYNVMVIKK